MISRTLGDQYSAAVVCNNLSVVALAAGQLDEARSWLLFSLGFLATSGLTTALSYALERSAAVLMAEGDAAFAVQLLSLVHTLRPANWVMPPYDRAYRDSLLSELRAKVDPALWSAWWTAGRIVAPERIIKETLQRLDTATNAGRLGCGNGEEPG